MYAKAQACAAPRMGFPHSQHQRPASCIARWIIRNQGLPPTPDSPNRGISCSLTPLQIGSTPRHSSQCQQNHQTQRESSHGNLMPSPPIPAAAPHRSAAARSFQIRRPGNAVAPRAGMGGVGAGLLLLLVLLLRAPSALHGTTGSFLPRSLLFAARGLAFRWHCEVLLGWLPHRRGGALALWSGGAGGDCARFRAASRRASWGLWYGAPFLSRASGAWNRGVTLASPARASPGVCHFRCGMRNSAAWGAFFWGKCFRLQRGFLKNFALWKGSSEA